MYFYVLQSCLLKKTGLQYLQLPTMNIVVIPEFIHSQQSSLSKNKNCSKNFWNELLVLSSSTTWLSFWFKMISVFAESLRSCLGKCFCFPTTRSGLKMFQKTHNHDNNKSKSCFCESETMLSEIRNHFVRNLKSCCQKSETMLSEIRNHVVRN